MSEKASRFPGLACLSAVALAACAHAPVPVVPPSPAAAPFDPSVLGQDASGLAAAAERLCATLAPAHGRALGFSLAQRARALAPEDRAASMTLARCAAIHLEWGVEAGQVESVAEAGIAAAKAAGAPADARAAYWLSVGLGLLLRQRGIAAVGRLPEEMEALKSAQSVPELELGGPLRALGMLYLLAPPWPAGPGDHEAALALLSEAAAKFPSHPQNHLFLAQALRATGDAQRASAELQRAVELARPELWGDYAARWQADARAAAQ